MSTATSELHHAFVIDRVLPLPDLQLVLTEGHHRKTGARVVHLQADDPENFFCVSFRTEPQHSHGVAHILEHLVLCGSELYPVRDPFMSMSRRSLHTFLNAFTGADFTAYPGASLIQKDYDHLLGIYLDAVFRPLLRDEGFRQEGWRVEFTEPDKASTPLTFRGVVYNEMKGAMSSPESRCWKRLMAEIFPDLTYRVNSGGDPLEIPLLSPQELRQFHHDFYHPSRSILFFYGDRPLQEILEQLDTSLAWCKEQLPLLPPIPPQKRLLAPRFVEDVYPAAQSGQVLLAMGWLTTSILDLEQQLALDLLQMVLMGTDASPLKRALMESELCQDVDSTFEDEMSEAPFVLMFRGLETDQAHDAALQLEALTLKTLREIADAGIPLDQVIAALDQLEFQKLEIDGGGGPFGLSLYWRSILPMQHGAPPEHGLGFRETFNHLRRAIQDPQFLSSVLRTQLIDNPHRITLLMRPDAQQVQAEVKAEQHLLHTLEQKLSPSDRERIIQEAQALKHEQETPQDLSCLPCLELTDIPRTGRDYALQKSASPQGQLLHHEVFTNGITTVELYLPLLLPAPEDLFWMQLAAQWIPECGFGGRPFTQTLQDLLAYTGGISVRWQLYPMTQDQHQWRPALCIRGKALARHVPKMLDLMREMLMTPSFQELDRLEELLDQEWSHYETSLSRLAHRFGYQLAAARFSQVSAVDIRTGGLDYVRQIRALHQKGKQALPEMAERLAQAAQRWPIGPADLVASCDAAGWHQLEAAHFGGLTSLPLVTTSPLSQERPACLPKEQLPFLIDGRVAYTALAIPTPAYCDPRSPLLSVASNLMENVILHKEIREKGGAYGAHAGLNALSGMWTFGSYSDPHIHQTTAAFWLACEQVARGEFSEQDLLEAQFSTLQGMDTPVAPGMRGSVAWRRLREGLTPDVRQHWRDGVLGATKEAIQQAVQEVLLPYRDQIQPIVFAGKEVLDREGIHNTQEMFSSP